MSDALSMDFVEHDEGFTVKTICGCRITSGPIPLREFGMLTPVSQQRHYDCIEARNLGLDSVSIWLRNGDRGMSSNAMCKRIFGVPTSSGIDHPHDPGDLDRCLKFLDAVEAHDKIELMRDVSPEWAALVDAWNEIVGEFREEMKAGKSAPRTYDLMKKALWDS